MMSSHCWITTFACLALFILPSRGDVVVDTPNIGLFWNKVYFSDTQFTEFYQCLSNSQTSSCTAWFKYFETFLFIGRYRVTTISKSIMDPTYQIDLLFYNCIVTTGNSKKIVCEKTSINCDDKNKYQRFSLTTGSFNNNNCVGITSEDTFQIKTDERFKTCQGDCYDGFSTTTITTIDVTATVIPITAIPTPDTKASVVTTITTSLTQDTTNLTKSIKKESDKENNTGIIVGVTVPLIILIVLIVLAIFFWRKLKQHRKTPEGNHQASNFGMSRDTMDMGGYENTHNTHGEEVLRTGQVASPNTYSNVDDRRDMTTNSNYNEITSIDGFSPPNPFLTTADSTSETLQDEGKASLPRNTSSTTDYSNIQSTDVGSNTGSPYAVVMKSRYLKPPSGNNNIKTDTTNNNSKNNSIASNAKDVTVDMPSPYSLAASDSVHFNLNNDSNSSLPGYDPVYPTSGNNSVETSNNIQTYDGTSSPYSMAVSDSFTENAENDKEATAPTYNTPDTPNTYSKLHENVRNMKNPYDALINAEGNSGKNNSQSDPIHSSKPTNEITEYSLARPDLANKNGHNSLGIESSVTEPNSSLVSGYGSEEESDRSEGFDFTGVKNGDTDKNPYFELEKVE